MSTPPWTYETPKFPGWYWYSCEEFELMAVEACDMGARLKNGAPRLWIKSRRREYWADSWQEAYGGFWLGPMRLPTLPEKAKNSSR